jgi:hypothetical protein
MRVSAALVALLGTVVYAAAPRPSQVAPAGTAVLTGVVVTDTSSPQAVRRATVRLAGAAGTSARLVGTDDAGRFVFDALPAGSVTLSATKPGLVPAYHGSKHPGRGPGVPIAIAGGARVEVTLKMLPGAALTGTITDALGAPTPGVSVAAVDLRPAAAAPLTRAVTDDRGVYRIFGLAPGEYLVAATPQLVPTALGRGVPNTDIVSVTDAEVRWALSGGGRAMPPPGRAVAYAPVFYPGTTDATAAERVTLSAGEERAGVSLAIRIVPVATISGAVVDGGGQPIQSATVSLYLRSGDRPRPADVLVSSGALVLPRGSGSGGTFAVRGVAPGDYTMVARTGGGQRGARPAAGDPAAPPPLWSVTDIAIDGNDRTDLVLRLLPGLRLSGSIVFDRGAAAPGDLGNIDVTLAASGSSLGAPLSLRAIVERTGTFRFSGIPPGTYILKATPPASPGRAPWVLKTAVLHDRDLADLPLEVRTSGDDVSGLVITFTDRAAEIAGRLVDAGGLPVTRYSIVVFAVDRAYWRPEARRVRIAQPATDGSFAVAGLPPGEYAIAAAEDVAAADLADASFLSALLASAHTLTVAEGERKRQDLRVRR